MALLPVGIETTIINDKPITKEFRGARVKVVSNIATTYGQYKVSLLEPIVWMNEVLEIGYEVYAQFDHLIHVTTNKEAKTLLLRR